MFLFVLPSPFPWCDVWEFLPFWSEACLSYGAQVTGPQPGSTQRHSTPVKLFITAWVPGGGRKYANTLFDGGGPSELVEQ